MKIAKKCSYCGGDKILKDAYASWSVEQQGWELYATYDNVICDDCGHETTVEDVILEP